MISCGYVREVMNNGIEDAGYRGRDKKTQGGR